MPRLRTDLDFMPSPVQDRPGLLIRDPFGYSDATLIVPPFLAQVLQLFDGESSELDIRGLLVELADGDVRASDLANHLIETLDNAGFLENDRFLEMRDGRHREFAEADARLPRHIGPGGYPEKMSELRSVFESYFRDSRPAPREETVAIAAPHVSPFGGVDCYAAAYSAIPKTAAERTFVVLGTSHYGIPEQFGLTRKPFVTPYGKTRPALHLVDELERKAPAAILMEDYCHAIEHSIEFQVVFLQHLFGPEISVLPILCGPYAESLYHGGKPEDNTGVHRFLDALGEINARLGDDLFWVLGVDMAHVGRRYGDQTGIQTHSEAMMDVSDKDHGRIRSISSGNAEEFWSQVQENQDPLRWCGSSPIYTFLNVTNSLKGNLESYGKWNIDEESVVSFAGMSFERNGK